MRYLTLIGVLAGFWLSAGPALGQDAAAPRQGAALLKTDILGVFAHPDDETGVAGTLATYALGKKAVVVAVYCTRGEGGGNMVGTQWGPALGILRETELRDCLATLGIRSCFFLDRLDWAYTESADATLQKWDHDETLERLVRLVRALRPEVIVTMNPAPAAGQHGHHQAAGVLATEAFTAAADPDRFPLQISREGLAAWQPRRLFYGGGNGEVVTTIAVDQPMPDGQTAGQRVAQALANHRSQAFGSFASSPFFQRPQKLSLVKTVVPVAGVETDLLAGLPVADEAATQPVRFARPVAVPPVRLAFDERPAIANYHRWVKDQVIEHIAAQFPSDLTVIAGEANRVALHVENAIDRKLEGQLELQVDERVEVEPARKQIEVAPRSTIDAELRLIIPSEQRSDVELHALLSTDQGQSSTKVTLHPVPRIGVPRITGDPTADASGSLWEQVAPHAIAPTDLVQGKAADAEDSSATFRLAHDGATLFVDVRVNDDILVSNIEPNDIRGHWRSDSVEICVDPAGGAADTLKTFKLGVFPFDRSGVVRAARDADANQGPSEETAPRTRIQSARTDHGYRIQAAIPFDELGIAPGSKRLGFNLIVYDGDKRAAAPGENINESRIAWAPRSGVQGRPEDWGRIDLE